MLLAIMGLMQLLQGATSQAKTGVGVNLLAVALQAVTAAVPSGHDWLGPHKVIDHPCLADVL
jgi:hypothetical protein